MGDSEVSLSCSSPGPTMDGVRVPFNEWEVKLKLPRSPLGYGKLVERMESALGEFGRSPCTFWACEGPNRPRHMVTCSRCWALWDLQVVLNHLRLLRGFMRFRLFLLGSLLFWWGYGVGVPFWRVGWLPTWGLVIWPFVGPWVLGVVCLVRLLPVRGFTNV